MNETLRVAALVAGGLGLFITVLTVAAPRINETARERYGFEPVSIFSTMFAGIVLLLGGTGLAARAMTGGWEPFDGARWAVPWPYESPAHVANIGAWMVVAAVVGMVGGTALLARRSNIGIALGSAACLLVLGVLAANPVTLPIAMGVAVFTWGKSINARSNAHPINFVSILDGGASWVCLIIAAVARDNPVVSGVFLGFGVLGLAMLLARAWYKEGLGLAIETLTCASLLGIIYAAVGVFIAGALASWHYGDRES